MTGISGFVPIQEFVAILGDMMKLIPIKNDKELDKALKRTNKLWDAKENTQTVMNWKYYLYLLRNKKRNIILYPLPNRLKQ